jgi:hypothetical protein
MSTDVRWWYVSTRRPVEIGDAVTSWQRPDRAGTVIGLDTARFTVLVRWEDRSTDWRAVGALDPIAPDRSGSAA